MEAIVENPKITTIIVIYNKELNESSVCLKIKKHTDVIIVDNGTKENKNAHFCESHDISYISMDGNKGLSRAYNTAIDHIVDTDAIVMLDDDTDVSDEYFIKLKHALIEQPDVDIFAPIMRGQDGVIYSPNNYKFIKNDLVENPAKEICQNRFNAISSCMAIRKRIFDNYRYNEKLFVDEIDHCFCREQREKGIMFAVLDVEISQNFHQRSKQMSPDSAWDRVHVRIIDIFRHARLMGGKKYTLLAFVKCFGLGVQIAKKSKSMGVMLKAGLLSCKMLFVDV